jgi:protein TonB
MTSLTSPFISSASSICYACLWRALALSLLLHAVALAAGAWLFSSAPKPRSPDALRVKLTQAPILAPPAAPRPAAPQPDLRMREDTPRKPVTAPVQKPALLTRPVDTAPASQRLVRPPAPRTESARDARELSGDAARKAGEQISKQLFYPSEAIERGLQGETLVLLFLDESGNAVAARIEASSGHALLDEAAVRAARTLRSLPASAPREAIVPVRFRLR